MPAEATSYRFRAALMTGMQPIMPREGFAFHRTPRRVYFIGFNKTATSSLAIMMMASGVLSIHSSGNGKLFGRPESEQARIPHATQHMLANIEAGRPPILGLEDYDAFMDLTVGPTDLCLQFETFFAADPNALFILNTRPVEDWIKSRIAHRRSVKQAARHYRLTPDQVVEKWRSEYHAHHAHARAFFAKEAPGQFLKWDIRSPATGLSEFLISHGIPLHPEYYFKIRETGGLFLPPPLRAIIADVNVPIEAGPG